jgi:hypothetical protein
MLKIVEFGLLAVALIIVLGLVAAGPPEAPPVEEHPIGAREAAEAAEQPKAS